ncbi:hypothetical protein SDC9_73272 [bioreactor metagenome]|uniref:Outer membrane protein TolC n=1 Tax=bioreactor metagenome TaxID=1076179 RepID=A0A644YEW4_9ZZZZ
MRKSLFLRIQISLFWSLTLLGMGSSLAQTTMTLKECINYASINSSDIKIANYTLTSAQQRIKEQQGNLLPQINASGSLENNLKLATQLMPAEMMGGPAGTYIAVKFGNKYSMSGGLQLNQSLLNISAIRNIKLAELNSVYSEQSLIKTNEETVFNVAVAFYQAVIIQMQIDILKSTLNESDSLLKSVELNYHNGVAKKTDVDKIRVSRNNTESQLIQAELSYSQSINALKYYMSMPVEGELVLDVGSIDSISMYYSETPSNWEISNILDYQLQNTNLSIMQMNNKIQKSSGMPTLSFYGNYNYNAMRQEFSFFESGNEWYSNSSIGLKLSVPLFDGFQRKYRVAQSSLSIKTAEENLIKSEQAIRLNISNYEIQYQNALDNIEREKENLDLAGSVYKSSQLEFQQGSCTTIELIQSESSFLIAQSNYYNKLLSMYIARIELEKAKGSLMNFLNK